MLVNSGPQPHLALVMKVLRLSSTVPLQAILSLVLILAPFSLVGMKMNSALSQHLM